MTALEPSGFHVGIGPITTQLGLGDARTAAEMWADALHMATRAEELGFASVWVGEHHFTEDGYLPAVFTMLGGIAARTTKVALGTKVLVIPLHHPVRVAEDAAGVQALSDGRFILGGAIGYREVEFAGLDLSKTGSVDRLEKAVQLCRAAWAGVGDHTEIFRPFVQHVPIWLGGAAPAALLRAGAIGDGFVAPVGPSDDVGRQFAVVQRAAQMAGRPPPGLASSSFVLLHHTDLNVQAQERCLNTLLDGYRGYKANDPLSRVGRRSESHATVVAGTPTEVAHKLTAYRDLLPPDHLHHHVVRLEYPGLRRDAVDSAMELFATEVLPNLVD